RVETEVLLGGGPLLAEVFPVTRLRVAEGRRLQARQRGMTGRVHGVGDDFLLVGIADVARRTLRRARQRVPEVGHPEQLLFVLPRIPPPSGVVGELMAEDPILVRPVTGDATDAVLRLVKRLAAL